MKIDIMTLFPDAIDAMMGQSIMGRAQERGYIRITAHQIRDYTTNKHDGVQPRPCRVQGGGVAAWAAAHHEHIINMIVVHI